MRFSKEESSMEERKYLRDQLNQSLRNEYRAVEGGWRFFSGLRFAVLSTAGTLQFGLFYGYQSMLAQVEADKLGDFGYTALCFMPAFAMVVTAVMVLVEWRAQELYLVCLERGVEVEMSLNILGGHFRKIQSAAPPKEYRWLSYTSAIRLINALIFVVWLYLYWLNVMPYITAL